MRISYHTFFMLSFFIASYCGSGSGMTTTTTTTSLSLCCNGTLCAQLIDDMEDGNLNSLLGTTWQSFQTSELGGGSSIPLSNTAEGAQGNRSLYFSFTLGSGAWQNASLVMNFNSGATAENLNYRTGLKFYAKGIGTNFYVMIQSAAITDFSYYQVKVTALSAGWNEYSLDFSSFVTPGWGQSGSGVVTLPQALGTATGFIFQVADGPSSSGELYLDHLRITLSNGECQLGVPLSTTTISTTTLTTVITTSVTTLTYTSTTTDPTKSYTTRTTTTTMLPVHGQVSIKQWLDDREAALSLTFDDNTIDHYTNVRSLLNSHNFKGTFYVVVNFGPNWSNFQTMAGEGHEIASHSMTHPNLTTLAIGNQTTPGTYTYELYESKRLIEQYIPGYKCLTVAYPYCAENVNVRNVADDYYLSARSCSGLDWNAASPTLASMMSLRSHFPTWPATRNPTDDDLPILTQMQGWLNNVIAAKSWGIYSAHQVVPFSTIFGGGGGYEPTSVEWLTDYLNFIQSKVNSDEVWVDTVLNVTKYINERNNLNVTVPLEDPNEMRLLITDGLDDSIYDFPITLNIVVNPLWTNVEVEQNAMTITKAAFLDGTDTVIQADLVPDGGLVYLRKL